MTSFIETGLVEPLQRALHENRYLRPTPIQAQAIPPLLEGRDVLGCARTGTGKTAAFALPILQRLAQRPETSGASAHGRAQGRAPRALVLVPTRELAAQVGESFRSYGRHLPISVVVIHGGVGQEPQVRALVRGVDVVVATPGRLLDLMQQRYARLDAVEFLVLDEADHMLDLGFLPDVRRIVSVVPKRRQTLLFSATMPPPISALADGILHQPVRVFVTPVASTIEETTQEVHFVDRGEKLALLGRILSDESVRRALIFTRTKHGANHLAKRLVQNGVSASAIHGNKSQNHRERSLESFRSGGTRVLVATDLAARGLDVDDITHVINYELPNVPETYVHRIGRTGRAGASGVAISLCDRDERSFLRDIERLIQRSIPTAGRPNEVARERAPAVARERAPEVAHERAAEPERAAAPAPVRSSPAPQPFDQQDRTPTRLPRRRRGRARHPMAPSHAAHASHAKHGGHASGKGHDFAKGHHAPKAAKGHHGGHHGHDSRPAHAHHSTHSATHSAAHSGGGKGHQGHQGNRGRRGRG